MNVVSEPGLYGLLLKSRTPAAQQFKRWVKQVVLPAIRKDGAYIKGEETAKTDDEIIALGMAAMQRKIDRLMPQAEGMDPGLVQNITVRDFVRKHGIVATKGQKTVLGQRASAASRVAGRERQVEETTTVTCYGSTVSTQLALYAEEILIRTARSLGLLSPTAD